MYPRTGQGGADDPHPMQMGTGNELLVSFNDVVSRRGLLARRKDTTGPADVVNAHHQNYGIRMRMVQHIAIESS
jgi:hypothetical protein